MFTTKGRCFMCDIFMYSTMKGNKSRKCQHCVMLLCIFCGSDSLCESCWDKCVECDISLCSVCLRDQTIETGNVRRCLHCYHKKMKTLKYRMKCKKQVYYLSEHNGKEEKVLGSTGLYEDWKMFKDFTDVKDIETIKILYDKKQGDYDWKTLKELDISPSRMYRLIRRWQVFQKVFHEELLGPEKGKKMLESLNSGGWVDLNAD